MDAVIVSFIPVKNNATSHSGSLAVSQADYHESKLQEKNIIQMQT